MLKRKKLAIAHLSTGSVGGAGIAARNLSLSLNSPNIISHFFSRSLKNISSDSTDIVLKTFFVDRTLGRLFTFINLRFSSKIFFSLFSKSLFKDLSFLKNYDVVHIHNWYNLLSLKDIEYLARNVRIVVITLHDQRFMTGGCHYSIKCNKFEKDCNNCPLLPWILRSKASHNLIDQKRIANYPNLYFVTPSKWLYDTAKNSFVLKHANLHLIGNHLHNSNSNNFKIQNKRKRQTEIRIGVASVHPYSFVKGGELLTQLETYIETHGIPVKIVYMRDYLKMGFKPQYFWREIDLLLLPSIVDNSPNVIFEAHANRVPVLGSSTGGIPEALYSNTDKLFDLHEATPEMLIENIVTLFNNFNNSQISENARDAINQNKTNLAKHIDFYYSITRFENSNLKKS